MLENAGLVQHGDVERAVAAQHQSGGTIGEHLVELGAIDDVRLLRALSRQTGLRHANLAKLEVPADAQALVRLETAKKHRVVPLAIEGRTLWLGMVNPADLTALQAVEAETGLPTQTVLLAGAQVNELLELTGDKGWGTVALRLPPRAEVEHTPLERNLQSLLRAMVAQKGQDLFLTASAIPAIRVDNELVRLPTDPMDEREIAELVVGALSPIQRETFAERMELDFAWEIPDLGRFRCNAYRQRGTVSFTARYIKDKIPTFEQLGVPPFLAEIGMKKQGLVLITGPTGHGKSTTMAALVDHINQHRHANVITIEDPVEFVHFHRSSNVNQREVGTDTRSFAEGLRHMFRQAPDVMVIGEMRDLESASIALTAAETGHLVIATLHSNNATASVDRIVDLYPSTQQSQVRAQLADALLLVFSQRLLRRANGKGRALAWEKVSSSLVVKNAIRDGKAHSLRAMMQANLPEVTSIDQSLVELVSNGTVTREEAAKWADSPSYLDDLLRARGVAAAHKKP
jgi:twitching motility protein PilT